MPSISVDVQVNLEDILEVSDLKKVVAYCLVATNGKVKKAAENLKRELWLNIGDGDYGEPACDRAYRKWLAEKKASEP